MGVAGAKAQVYSANVSADSLAILKSHLEALKASQKVVEMKMDEAKEEAEVEKLRIKLLAANDKAKQSAEKSSKHAEKAEGESVDVKETAKVAKQAKNDMQEAEKALDRYNKQIKKIEKLRDKIQAEERKLGYTKPTLSFHH